MTLSIERTFEPVQEALVFSRPETDLGKGYNIVAAKPKLAQCVKLQTGAWKTKHIYGHIYWQYKNVEVNQLSGTFVRSLDIYKSAFDLQKSLSVSVGVSASYDGMGGSVNTSFGHKS